MRYLLLALLVALAGPSLALSELSAGDLLELRIELDEVDRELIQLPTVTDEPASAEDWPEDFQLIGGPRSQHAPRLSACPECEVGPPDGCYEPGVAFDPKLMLRSDWYDHTGRYGPHRNLGIPLHGTSWLNRPHHVGWFFGGMFGDNLLDGVEQESGLFGGYRLGHDFDHYWGWEGRLGFATPHLSYESQPDWEMSSDVLLVDTSVLYYPWGDAAWRPYLTAGLGLASFSFQDEQRVDYDEMAISMPLGAGVKYRAREWLILRVDLLDNIAFGGSRDIDPMHNFSVTAGVEVRFGGHQKTYMY